MLPPTAVIKLDASAAWEPPDQPPWPRHPSERWLAIGLVLVGVFALVAGAQRVTPLTPSVVLRGDGISDIRSDGHSIYLMRQSDVTRTFLESYRMPDGTRRWTSRVEAHSQLVDVNDERVVLAVAQPGENSTSTLVGLDAASGAQVWRRTGYAPSLSGSGGALGVVLANPYTPGAEPQQEQQSRSRQQVGIDTRTGDIRWSFVTSAGSTRSYVSLERGIASYRVEIAELDPDGMLRVRSAESAEIVRTAKLDHPGQIDGFDISGDRLLAYRSGQSGTLGGAVFDLATGRRLWQHAAEPTDAPLWWCGRTLCTGNGGTIAALDPDTGRELWRLDGWTSLDPLDDRHLLATRSAPVANEPWLGGLVIDTTTGRIVRRIVGWDVVDSRAWPDVLVASRDAAGNSLVARLNVDTGAVMVFGRAEHWHGTPQCITTATLLACRLGQVSIWRLPA